MYCHLGPPRRMKLQPDPVFKWSPRIRNSVFTRITTRYSSSRLGANTVVLRRASIYPRPVRGSEGSQSGLSPLAFFLSPRLVERRFLNSTALRLGAGGQLFGTANLPAIRCAFARYGLPRTAIYLREIGGRTGQEKFRFREAYFRR